MVEFVVLDDPPKRGPAQMIPHPALELVASPMASCARSAILRARPGAAERLTDAVRAHRKRLEQIGVAEFRIEFEIAALEQKLFPKPMRRRA